MDFCYALVAAAFAEKDASSRGVREHMSSHGLAAVGAGEESTRARVALDLVCLFNYQEIAQIWKVYAYHQHADVEFYNVSSRTTV